MEEANSADAEMAEAHSSSGSPLRGSNIASSEIDEETTVKLRGDAIGDTMYSEVFILNTLLQFSNLNWSSEVEENLCVLWDMTEEKDVCEYLYKMSYPTLACSAIMKYNEPRFIEIVLGILANLLCSQCENKTISEEEMKIVFNLLESNDPYILIQVMRSLHAISFKYDKLHFISEDHVERIHFILYSSTNKELLLITLKTLASITDDSKLDENLIKDHLLSSAVTAYKLIKETTEEGSEFERENDRLITAKYLLQFVCNLCNYVPQRATNLEWDEFLLEMGNLLEYYSKETNVLPISEEFNYYMEALVYILRNLQITYKSSLVTSLCRILIILKDNIDSVESLVELFCYCISVGSPQELKSDILTSEEIKSVLEHVLKCNRNFEFDYKSKLRELL